LERGALAGAGLDVFDPEPPTPALRLLKSPNVVQRFGGTCFTVHEADVAVVVTTSDFTAPAVEYAEQCGIVCVDGSALRAWSDGLAAEPWAVVPDGFEGRAG
ncbi:restriction endonuclease, partial [Streptomyces sp. NPDC003362]